ncbi:MAG: T9SS type A sorting domain-containing protein [Lentimicrobiaceae bacterium]|nr:T9SS type A sorting domain-containing protein [Lentimicrobiaceae bacterium]
MKRFIIVSALFFGAFSAKAQFAGGDGSPQDPYQISTVNQLDSIRYFSDNHFILLNDLDIGDWISNHPDADMRQNGWKPIDSVFSGSLNGQGYTLSGFFINRPDDISCGLFEELSVTSHLCDLTIESTNLFVYHISGILAGTGRGKIENCHATGGTIHAYGTYIGGLFGIADSLTAISCSSNINIISSKDSITFYTGGLFGLIMDSEIKSCHAKGNIYAVYNVGGIAGHTFQSNYTNCFYTGNITGGQQCGGISGSILRCNVNNCYTSGKMEATTYEYISSFAGGLVGLANYSDFKNCYSTMDILSSDNWTVGGLLGYSEGEATIQNCYAAGHIEGSSYVGGLFGQIYAALVEKCVAVNLSMNVNDISDTRRIGGRTGIDCNLQNNFAFEGMLLNGERQTGTSSGTNGEDLSGEDIMRQSTYTQPPLEWDFTPQTGDWKMPSSGCLPILAWQDDISDTADCFRAYLSYLSVKEKVKNENTISIYPCPASDYVNIQISDDMPTNDLYAYLYDVTGRLLHTQILENKTTRIDLTDFTAGFYVLKVNNHTFKVVKK